VGDMPRNKQFGYLFSSPFGGVEGATVAHEVGHGLFNLKHTFDGYFSGTDLSSSKNPIPNNVMSYPSGDEFSKLQWDAVHDPGLVIGLFESDKDAQSDKVTIDSLLNWIKSNLGKKANFERDNFFKSHAWVDAPLYPNFGTNEVIVLYVDLGKDDGLVNMQQNTGGVYKNMSIAVHYEGKYAEKYHTGYSLTIPYASKEGAAITIWAYSFDDYSKLLSFLGLDFTEIAKESFRKKYKQELLAAGKDCNKLDILYENMPPFVLEAITDEDLWAHLVSISSCSMRADEGTDEEKAALNIMRGFKDRKKLYDKLYQKPQVVKELYDGIDGDNCFSYLNILTTLTNTYGKNPTEKQYAYIGKVPNNKYPSHLDWNGKDYFTTVGVGNINGPIAIGTQVGRMNVSPFNWGSVQVWGDINHFQVNNLLDQGVLYKDEEKNMDILPAIYIGHLAEKDGQGKLLSAINTGTMAVGFLGSARVLFAKGAGYIAKGIAFSELSKLAIDAFMSNEDNKKEVASWGSEGKWIADNWTTISTTIDLTTLGSQLLVNFVRNGTKVSGKFKVRGNAKEADELDEMIKSASAVKVAREELIASIKARLGVLKNPARPILAGEGIPLVNGKQTRIFGTNKFDNVVTGSYGDASKKYIWTIDDNGINIGLEQTPIGSNSVIKHTNLSPQAYSGGEAWFINQNKVHVNAWSGRFGAGANMTKAEWDASIDAFKSNGYEVIVEPYNP